MLQQDFEYFNKCKSFCIFKYLFGGQDIIGMWELKVIDYNYSYSSRNDHNYRYFNYSNFNLSDYRNFSLIYSNYSNSKSTMAMQIFCKFQRINRIKLFIR